MTLITKGRFSAFQDSNYPAHITALLDVDLLQIGSEIGLTDAAIEYTRHGRVPLTPRHYPTALSTLFPRALSDNLLYIARKPTRAQQEAGGRRQEAGGKPVATFSGPVLSAIIGHMPVDQGHFSGDRLATAT